MRGAVIILLLLSGAQAHAADALIRWPVPTQYPDGTMMPTSDFAFVNISWVIVGTNQKGNLNFPILPANITIKTPCGKYIFTGSYTTGPKAHVPNATSNNATATYDTGIVCQPGVTPKAPTNLQVR